VTQFAERAKGDVVLISSHYYAMGPAGAPGIDAQKAGCAGVNLHGGGEGYYALITGEPNATKLRPEYYGMLLAQQFAGATFAGVSLAGNARCECLRGTQEDALLVAMVNKSGDPVEARLRGGMTRATECSKLTAPSLDAKDGVEFARANMDERLIPGYAAVVWKFQLR
jgi:hypothetical protein